VRLRNVYISSALQTAISLEDSAFMAIWHCWQQ